MRVLVTGAAGMLGTDVCVAMESAGHAILATDVAAGFHRMDIADHASVSGVLSAFQPDRVIHCAAYTNVDQAEREPDAAYRLNALGSWVVATVCAEHDVPLVAISTDYVFDGTKSDPYTEFDAPNPTSHYGASKLAGENLVRSVWRKHWIVRTAWLFGVHGKCFPNSILTAAETRPELKVVADQTGSPTFTADLAQTLARLIDCMLYGTYHCTNRGATTWYEFASAAVELAGIQGVKVTPIASDEWSTPVKRPANSVLRPLALEMQGAYDMRPWREALADYVARRAAHRAGGG